MSESWMPTTSLFVSEPTYDASRTMLHGSCRSMVNDHWNVRGIGRCRSSNDTPVPTLVWIPSRFPKGTISPSGHGFSSEYGPVSPRGVWSLSIERMYGVWMLYPVVSEFCVAVR